MRLALLALAVIEPTACSSKTTNVTESSGATSGTGAVAGTGSGGATGGVAGSTSTGGVAGTSGSGAGGTGGVAGDSGTGAVGATGGIAGTAGTGMTGGTSGTGGSGGTPVTCTGTAGPPMVAVPQGFCIDSTEVTNAQYAAFVASGYPTTGQDAWCSWNSTYKPQIWPATGLDAHPVANVDWCDAYAFCKWAGKRLCGRIGGGSNAYGDYANATNSQWYAVCSAGGAKTYPYGSTYQATTCNGAEYTEPDATLPVGTASGCVGGYPGVYDLSGNVWEWEDSCAGTGSNDDCRIRGGSFLHNNGLECGFANKGYRSAMTQHIGFRCCGP